MKHGFSGLGGPEDLRSATGSPPRPLPLPRLLPEAPEEEEEAEATDAMAAEPFIMPFEKVALNEHGKFVHEKLRFLMRD